MEEETRQIIQDVIPDNIRNKAREVKVEMDQAIQRFERRNRVTNTTIVLMLSVAGLYDYFQLLVNLIPFIGWIFSFLIGIYAWLTFYVWTSVVGWNKLDTGAKVAIKYLHKTKWAAKYILPFVGLIPVVNSIPEITAGVLLSILIVKSEDFIYNKSKGRTDEKVIEKGIEFFKLFRNVYHV